MGLSRTMNADRCISKSIGFGFFQFGYTLVIFWLLTLSQGVLASVIVTETMSGLSIKEETTIIEDPERRFILDEVLSQAKSSSLLEKDNHRMIEGFSESAWWLVIDIENMTDSPVSWILESVHTHTDYLDLYHIKTSGEVLHLTTGDKRAFSERPFVAESFAFPLTSSANSKETLVLRFAYEKAGLIQMSLRRWDQNAFQQYQTHTHVLYGILFGAGLFAIIYTLIIHIPSRSKAFYWYLGYLIFVLGNVVANSGLGHRFLWQTSEYLTDAAHFIFSSICFVCALQFNRVFLQTRLQMPRADKLLIVLILMATLGGLIYLLGDRVLSAKLLLITALLMSIMPLIGLWSWLVLKRVEARWYVFAWSIWSIAMMVIVGRMSGAIELSSEVLWFSRMGFLLEAVLLSMALIDHINSLRKAKLDAEEKLIKSLESSNTLLEQKVRARTLELEQAKQQAENLAETDMLTGIGNRRYLFSRGLDALKLTDRLHQPLSLMMIDIDHFKKINDSQGHATGDRVIQCVAQLASKRVRETDILGRIGGEEFAIILIGTPLDKAQLLAEQLRLEIEQYVFDQTEGGNGSAFNFTVSCGVTSLEASESLEGLMQRADKALYEAKRAGRNCVRTL